MKERLNYGKTFLLGFGFFGVSVIWSVYNPYVPLFLANRFGLSAAWIGFFMTLDNIAALLIQPWVGAWSDRLRTPIGRRMPFILIGAPLGALAFGLIPLAAVLPLFVACTTTLLLSMALWRTPVIALMPDITPSQYRSQANGVINFMGGVGSIVSFLVGAMLYRMNPAFPFWLGSVLVITSSLLVFTFIREPKTFVAGEDNPALWKSLQQVIQDGERSALRMLLAIFFWFIGYNAVEAFFTLYANRHLGLPEADGAALLGHLSLIFVLFALPSGFLGGRFGRRPVIMTGITLMALLILGIYLAPASLLTISLVKLPAVGTLRVVSLFLMGAGMAWAFININSLPMVVDMTDASHLGTFTGLYYLFSTLAAIVGPNINGWIIQLSGHNYNTTMMAAPLFFLLALLMISGVRRGEAQPATPKETALPLP